MKAIKYLIIFLLWAGLAYGANQTVGSGGDYAGTAAGFQSCAAARADGEYCYVLDGTYNNLGAITIDDARTAATYIKAQNPGQVTFSGTSKFVLSGNYWVLEGFVFDGFSGASYERVVHISGDYNKVTNSEFRNFGGSGVKPQAIRVEYTGDYAEISYNYFHDLAAQVVIAYATATDVALEPHIHHNYFKDNTYATAFNDDTANIFLQGILGTSDDQDMAATIEYNVFENFTGDSEGLCIKNSSNIIRYNVFLNIGGGNAVEGVSLRLGEDTLVFNNWFIRTDTSNMAGINVSDKGHKIVNNYFYGLGGALRGVYFLCGETGSRDKAENVLFESNTFYNCTNSRLLQFGANSTLPPTNITIRNNIFSSGRTGYDYTSGTCTATWDNNVLYASAGTYFTGTGCDGAGGFPADSADNNRLLEAEFNAIWANRVTPYATIKVLDAANVAIETGYYDVNYATDIDGQARSDGVLEDPDIGCDEYSTATLINEPIPTGCVYPSWHANYDCEWPPPVITSPNPGNGATGVSISTTLSWTNPEGYTSVDVYFDDDVGDDGCPEAVPTKIKAAQDISSVSNADLGGNLGVSQKYCWRVDVNHAGGTETGFDLEFTTASGPPTPPASLGDGLPSDSAGDVLQDDSAGDALTR